MLGIHSSLTGHSLRSARSTGLDLTMTKSANSLDSWVTFSDLPSLKTDGEVGNVDRLGLTGSVRGHDTPAVGLRELDGLDGLGDGTDLVDLEEQGVARLLLDGSLDSERVGDGQVITDNLDLGRLVEVGPGIPVVLGEGVLDGANVVLLAVAVVQVGELLSGEPLGRVGVGVLNCQLLQTHEEG